MSLWLVNQGDRQFSVSNLGELKQLAKAGKLGPGDMIQPPGANDWMYATELPEIKDLLQTNAGGRDFDDDIVVKSSHTAMIIGVLVVLLSITGAAFYHFANKLPEAQNLDLLGKGGLELTQMLVTADPAPTFAKPESGASKTGSVDKDSKVQLIAKRGKFYQIEHNGDRGWVRVDDVVPAYFFADKETRQDYDPIYNADRYVFVKNASWMQLPNQRHDNITIFQLMLANKSKFDMTDVILLATIKDKNGKVLETAEVPLEGVIKSFDETMLGTLAPPDNDHESEPRLMTETSFEELAKQDEDLRLRWSPGIEVQLGSTGFVEANIDMLQVTAVPKKM
ncbi:MAG: SH3 domain-containing protein [Oligoflexia bacterium]|nr:SH3 domain-containing protein [Oligoflexia bacterium]